MLKLSSFVDRFSVNHMLSLNQIESRSYKVEHQKNNQT